MREIWTVLLRLVASVCTGLILLAALAVSAEAAEHVIWTPEALAAAVERQASRASFSDLEHFGHDALTGRQADRLQRLEHVAWLELYESDYPRFSYWNGQLRAEALKAGDLRYVAIADLDRLRSRYDQGDVSAEAGILAVARTATDGMVRSRAMMLEAYFLTVRGQAAEALRLLSDADHLAIATKTPEARADIWDTEGLALMKLQDLNGSAIAFGRSQFEFGRPDYPRPDFDSIWNLAGLAAKLGRADLAETLYAVEHRLALSSKVSSLGAWDDDLCAVVAETRDAPKRVLSCLQPLGPALRGAQFLAPRVLPARAIAYARLGQLQAARRDLATFRNLKREMRTARQSVFERLPEVEAEVLHAEGRDRAAFETLRHYARAHQTTEAQAFGQGVGQLTGLMAEQLSFRQNQLVMTQKNLALVDRVVRDQRLMGWAGGLLGLAVLVGLGWQWRVSRQLRTARIEAEAGSRAKGEFLANMSHEIRTPLNGLLTMADVMDRDVLPAEQKQRLAVVRQSGRDLLHLINDILDFSKIEAGKLELETIAFDVERSLQSTLAGFATTAEAKGLELRLDIAPNALGIRRGDPGRVRQIVANFVSNALKFTASGSVHITIEGVGAEGHDGLQIAVQDTGLGIPPEKMSLLFQKFSQLDASTTRRFGGTGLGLAICQELASLMGGRVWAESVEGQGSTFFTILNLPFVEAAAEAAEVKDKAEDCETAVRPLRLLAAEDNATNRLVLSTIMQIFGFDLVVVEDGAQAVEAWRTQQFDAILMDVQMPVMDGVQATREIRAVELQEGRPRTPIIALSANAFTHQINEYLAAGMDVHVAKPIELPALQSALEAIFQEQVPPKLAETI
ncbi:ATP-binding protein [Caulobacter sp. S45]|uniref:hybrid sensor histidine kinase/response regulator n=1 Tax=Caulobacter sp. S45 TaxID=1641861 RepID=UPI00131D25E0|nr:ATP-binding protein [Caulobacter sp. S45]